MAPHEHARDLDAKSYKNTDVFDESSLNDVFIDGVKASIRHSLRLYWESNPQAHLTSLNWHRD